MSLARALMSESRIYFLDEPFVGIDFRSEDIIMQKLAALKRSGKLILLFIMTYLKLKPILIVCCY